MALRLVVTYIHLFVFSHIYYSEKANKSYRSKLAEYWEFAQTILLPKTADQNESRIILLYKLLNNARVLSRF